MSRPAARLWALLFVLSILFGTLMPAAWRDAIFGLFPHGVVVQKTGHVVAFAGAAFLALRGAPWQVRPWHILAMGLLVAIATEWMQVLVRGRSPSMRDLALDMGGVCLGLALARLTGKPGK